MAKANTAVVVLERGRRTTAAQLRRDASLAVFSPPPVPAVLPAVLVLRTVACPRACLQVVTPLIPKRRTCKGHSMILSCVPKGSPPSPSSPSPNAATPATISPHATTLFFAILTLLSIKHLLWQGSMRDGRKSGAIEISVVQVSGDVLIVIVISQDTGSRHQPPPARLYGKFSRTV